MRYWPNPVPPQRTSCKSIVLRRAQACSGEDVDENFEQMLVALASPHRLAELISGEPPLVRQERATIVLDHSRVVDLAEELAAILVDGPP